MSWRATAWAKSTRGHKGMSGKLLLLVLADYHSEETGTAWPSQKRLAEDCEMPLRTVKYALDALEREGFITTVQKGNQHQPTVYQLNLAVVHAQSYEGAMEGSAMVAPASEGAMGDKVKVQKNAGAYSPTDTILYTNLHRASINEPPRIISHSTLLGLFSLEEQAELAKTFPGIDLNYQAQKCTDWWAESKRPMKRPRTAFRNWLEKAIKLGGQQNGTHPQSGQGATEQPVNKFVRQKEILDQRKAAAAARGIGVWAVPQNPASPPAVGTSTTHSDGRPEGGSP